METRNTVATAENRWSMMQRLQEIGLTLIDLTEYLDTHTQDSFAMARHSEAVEEYRQLLSRYEQLFGPLSLGAGCPPGESCPWALQDFPWDYEL